MPVSQNVLDALNQADADKTAAAVALASTAKAQAALDAASSASSSASSQASASSAAAMTAVSDWLAAPATVPNDGSTGDGTSPGGNVQPLV